MFITRYNVELCYGGPEEGGWHFDWRTPDTTIDPVVVGDQEQAYHVCRALNAYERELAREAGEYDYTSVLGGHQLSWHVEDTYGEDTTTVRPHYE